MKPVSKQAQEFLDRLFMGMDPGTGKKIANSKVYMPLTIERLTHDRYSMTHYFEQNGDLVPDPDLELWRGPFGHLYAVAIQHSTGAYCKAIEFGPDDQPTTFKPRAQRDMNAFLTQWVKNIKQQQEL